VDHGLGEKDVTATVHGNNRSSSLLFVSRHHLYSYVYYRVSHTSYYTSYSSYIDCCIGYSRLNGVCMPQCAQGCIHGVCTSPNTCTCDSGWTGVNCNSDINECTNGVVRIGEYFSTVDDWCQQRCINTIGSYECGCDPGYLLGSNNRTCTDIDECECSTYCNSSIDVLYNCSCHDKYDDLEENLTCTDYCHCCNKKTTSNCEQVCINTEGSYNCSCYGGFNISSENSSKCDGMYNLYSFSRN
jgi:hypothetical protein